MKETDLVKQILLEIGEHFPNNIRAWRNNSGSVKDGTRFIVFGVKGQADITGIMDGGRRLEVECKTEKGKQSIEQKHFQNMIEAYGGIYLLVRSLDEFMREIRKYI